MASAGRDDELPRRWHGTQEARDPAQVAASEHRPHGDQGSPGGHLRTGLQLGSGTELGERPVGRPGGRWTGAEDEARPSRTWQGWGVGCLGGWKGPGSPRRRTTPLASPSGAVTSGGGGLPDS